MWPSLVPDASGLKVTEDAQHLRRGRLYFLTGPGFDPDFIRRANKVLSTVRRALVRRSELGPHYFGPAALAWIQGTGAQATESGLELVAGAA